MAPCPVPYCCRLLLVGRSTCPFCIEVSRTFSEMGLPYTYYQGALPDRAQHLLAPLCLAWVNVRYQSLTGLHTPTPRTIYGLHTGLAWAGLALDLPFCCHHLPCPSHKWCLYTHSLALPAVDKLPNGTELHQSLKEATGQKTVPYVYISGQMVGGCNDTKDLIASGEFDKKLGALGELLVSGRSYLPPLKQRTQ